MDNYCSFNRVDGKIVYKYTNMITGQNDTPLTQCCDGELINDNEIYVSLDGKKFYHKSNNPNMFDINTVDISNENIYVEWKQTNKGDWDWYKTDNISSDNLINIKDLFDENLNEARNLDEKIKYLKMKTEIMTYTYVISKKHNLDNNDILNLTKLIETTIQSFIIDNLT